MLQKLRARNPMPEISRLFPLLLAIGRADAAVDAAGDCAFVGIYTDPTPSPKNFAILLLDSMAAGERIFVTDNAVEADGTLRVDSGMNIPEGVLYYEAAPGGITAGTVLQLSDFADADPGFLLSASGDQLIAYTSTDPIPEQGATSPTSGAYLCALSTKSSGGWITTGTTDASNSYVPTGLTVGSTALGFSSHKDNGAYDGSMLSGTASELATAINTIANWLVDNTQTMPFVVTGYTVTSTGGGSGDPHISFANGGRADFRGSHRDCYVFVSSPGYQFSPYFQEVDFDYTSPSGVMQLVHGTFMTRAFWRIRSSESEELLLATDAMYKGELEVVLLSHKASRGTGPSVPQMRKWSLKQWSNATFGDVTISTRMLTVSVETPEWRVDVTSKPVYGLVAPILNETHYNGRYDPEQRRLDIQITGLFPQENAHGIVGQSFRDPTVRNGKVDEYGALATPENVTSDGVGPEMWTSAQAEGAIDGVYTDYKLPRTDGPYSTAFVYSRFNDATAVSRSPANRPTVKRTSTTSEWTGLPARKKEL